MRRETPFSGVNIESEDVSLEAGPVERPFYMYLRVSLPVSVSLLALVLTLTTVAICLRKSKLSHLIANIFLNILHPRQMYFKGKRFSVYMFCILNYTMCHS
jgi:hypothetical protein